MGNLPSFGSNCFNNTNINLKLYRKKNFVTGWGSISSIQGVPVKWSDNVIKSGGTGKIIGKNLNDYKPIITSLGLNQGGPELPNYYIELSFNKNGIRDNLVQDYQVDIMQVEAGCPSENYDVTFSSPPFDPSIISPKISNNIEYANVPINYLQVRIRAVGKKSNTFSSWSDPFSIGTPC